MSQAPVIEAARATRLLAALRHEPVDCTPVWFMRQAGRALPEYRAIREKYDLMEICRQPELCAGVTVQPVRRLGVDAAVMFADIMLPLMGIGVGLELVETIGPVIAKPVRSQREIQVLRPLEPESDVGFVLEAIRCVLQELGGEVPLIGFSGAPFTLASYLIEGKPSRDFVETKSFMYREPVLWKDLMQRLTDIVCSYLSAQIEAGVQAVQLFDSWVGSLSASDYDRYVLPYSRQVFEHLRPTSVPTIHFGTNTAGILERLVSAGGDAIGVDWRIPIGAAWERMGFERGIQGNLDPLVLLAPWPVLEREAMQVLAEAGGRPGHIFNLGHGVNPQTPADHLVRLVELVHESTRHDGN